VRSLPGVSNEDFAATKLAEVKKKLNGYVKSVAQMVNADWHDGYEEQGEKIGRYFEDVFVSLQAVYNIVVVTGLAFERCHEIMKAIVDSWDNMKAVPMRGGVEENYENLSLTLKQDKMKSFFKPEAAFSFVWRLLIHNAVEAQGAEAVEDEVLKRMIKDAEDNSCNVLGKDEDDSEEEEGKDEGQSEIKEKTEGQKRLERVHSERVWDSLPTTKKVHRMRKGIDRRFDGPKHLRTRDYDSDEGI